MVIRRLLPSSVAAGPAPPSPFLPLNPLLPSPSPPSPPGGPRQHRAPAGRGCRELCPASGRAVPAAVRGSAGRYPPALTLLTRAVPREAAPERVGLGLCLAVCWGGGGGVVVAWGGRGKNLRVRAKLSPHVEIASFSSSDSNKQRQNNQTSRAKFLLEVCWQKSNLLKASGFFLFAFFFVIIIIYPPPPPPQFRGGGALFARRCLQVEQVLSPDRWKLWGLLVGL